MASDVESDCGNTLRWLISFSLDRIMRLPKFRWAVVVGAVAGAAVPLFFFAVRPFQYFVTTGRGIFLWPSGIWLMATDMEGRGYNFSDRVILGISILANILL